MVCFYGFYASIKAKELKVLTKNHKNIIFYLYWSVGRVHHSSFPSPASSLPFVEDKSINPYIITIINTNIILKFLDNKIVFTFCFYINYTIRDKNEENNNRKL